MSDIHSFSSQGKIAEFVTKHLKPDRDGHVQVTEAKTQTASSSVNVENAEIGHTSIQGVRPTMEDQVDYRPDMIIKGHPFGFYAVYDGHGGKAAAKFARAHLCDTLVAELTSRLSEGSSQASAEEHDRIIRESLTQAFLKTDEAFIQCQDKSGSTAVVALIDQDSQKVYVANVGDSRAVLGRKGQAIALSRDHKATRPDEVERIEKAGGFVVRKRVLGRLAVSRAIGDGQFTAGNEQLVIANPDIIQETLGADDEFLVLACDGLWDVLTNEQVVRFVYKTLLVDNVPAQKVSELLVREAVKNQTMDNVSTLVVRLK